MAASIPREVGVEGAMVGAHLLSRPAEEFGNDPNLETAWALKAVEHMEVYFNLLCSVDPRLLKLTPHDDDIFKEFKETFPDFPISVLCEEKIKSEESKMKWRPFCNKFANIVEDYNFGTLVRIDSSDEYSETNTILVPRIQFYAIEIARNREGCNDGIRAKFKPTPRNKEPIPGIYLCRIRKIVRRIEEVFKNLCDQFELSPVEVKRFIRKESGSERKGDFSVFLGSPQMKQFLPYINQVIHQLTSDDPRGLYISKCAISSDHLIQFTLDRPSIFHEVLSEVSEMKGLYGSSNRGQGLSVLISVCCSKEISEKSSIYVRNEVIAQHLASVLQYNGFQIFLAADPTSRIEKLQNSLGNIEHIYCSEICNTDNLCQLLLKKAKDSKWRKDFGEMKLTEKVAYDLNMLNICEEVILDSRQYLTGRSKSSSYKTYFKKMDNIYVQANGFLTESFKRAVHLEHILNDHMDKTPKWIIHIGPECDAHLLQSSGLLLEMLTEKNFTVQQIYMSHVNGSFKNHLENNADCLYGKIKQEMETALTHKYGPEILNEQTWIPCISILTETAFKFDLLSNPSFPPKTVREMDDKSKAQERKRGTFVQYNCARLSRLFKRHEDLVNEGIYSSLPPVDEVDFSFLKLQEEWNLLFNYVLPFPTLINSIYEDLQQSPTAKVRCPSHEVCHMLINLSQDLSLYYNRTRILVQAVPHLQKTMVARIWLLRGVHQVMKNALSLLGIEALEKM